MPFTFSALREPRSKTLRKTLRSDSKAQLNRSFAYRQRVIELHGVGEVAHAELVQPLQRASSPLCPDHQFHSEFLCVHVAIIARWVSGGVTIHPTNGHLPIAEATSYPG